MLDTVYYNVLWDGKDDNGVTLTSGLYLIHMVTEESNMVKKVLMMK
jgi:flagellar hook assembly protein FlgD